MKKNWLPIAFVIAAAVATAQETTPPREGSRAAQRQFAGEVVAADLTSKMLTVKAHAVDPNGERTEKTLAMAVAESAVPQLGTLKPGDKVNVLWQRDEAERRDMVITISKAPAPPETEKQ
jgi:Cu/Ag efflux protein CusF